MKNWKSAALVMAALAGSVFAADNVGRNIIAESNQRAMEALEADPTLTFDPGSLLVKFRSARAAGESAADIAALVGGEVVQQYDIVPGLVHITLTAVSVEDAIALLQTLPEIEYAEPDYFVHHMGIPNDPSFGQLWGMNNSNNFDIDAPQGWDIFTGDANFRVAVIDTGVQYTHPDLAANIWINPGEIAGNNIDDDGNGYVDDVRGWDFANNDNNPMDDNGHGTHCAGTVAAVGNNGVGVAGVAWLAKIVPLKFLGANGSGSISAALNCLQYCTRTGVKVSNNSWGGGGFSSSFQSALTQAAAIGHVFVAAAGNNGSNNDNSPSYPASYTNDNVIAVASITSSGARSSFSNFGVTSVDVGAPGSNVFSTYPTNSYTSLSGTSMASPHAAGVVTMVYAQNPNWTYQQVRSRVLTTVRRISSMNGVVASGGIVNLASALVNNNTNPVVTITAPANNSAFAGGTSVLFTGTSTDTQDGNLSSGLTWTSSMQGAIGSGASFSNATLMVGTHTITARSNDSQGGVGLATVTLTIVPNGVAPAAPSSVRTYRSGVGVNVTWDDNSSNEFGFQIVREQRVGLIFTNQTVVGTVGPNTTSFFNQPPATGQTWRYAVRSFGAGGSSNLSAWATFSN